MLETLHIRLSLVGSMFDFILVSDVFSSINKVPYPHDFFMHVLRLYMERMHQKKEHALWSKRLRYLVYLKQNWKLFRKNSADFINWTWLLVQLIYSGVVEPENDQLLFTMVSDMLIVLIHHIIALEPNLDNNRHYQAIIKKISKETKDFSDVPNTKAINHVTFLLD